MFISVLLLIPSHGIGSGWQECTSSVRQSVGPSVTVRVHAVTYVCIDGLPSNLVQMVSSLRRCAVTLTRIHTSKVKDTRDQTTIFPF